ncbi:MAG: 2-phospho-L-lactate transferase [Chloroflexi bacterium]|nr:2-phospho-L-lactate transferase [Chloroflexota bacterium]
MTTQQSWNGRVLALAGGVGGAKLALGLARIIAPPDLVIGVNTGDDECFYGLHVSPDLDTVMYTLAGMANPETGWGLAGDTFDTLEMLRKYGVDAWFNLGDRDMATHLRRSQLLRGGATLSSVTAELSRALGVEHTIAPMSDDSVKTVVTTAEGDLAMQEYFVKRLAEPPVESIRYVGAESAQPSAAMAGALAAGGMLVLCPSNPFLSLGPILAVPGIRRGLEAFSGKRVAVSPIVGGAALRGPAAKMMAELGHEATCVGVARQYQGICDFFFIDDQDAESAPAIRDLGIQPVIASIIMESEADKVSLARQILELADR